LKKYHLGEGFYVKVLFYVYYNGDKDIVVLKTEFWLPFPPTVGLALNSKTVDYPPIKTVKYHVGTDKFTVTLEESSLWDYNKDDILQLYSDCEEIK
jgi:hypothetical protein